MGSRPRFRSPCVTAPAHLLPYAPLYPLLPVLTRCAASYPPGLAALCRVPAVLRGLRFARSPLRYRLASPAPRSEPRLLSCPHAPRLRSCPPRLTSCRVALPPTTCLPPSLLLPDGVAPSEPRSVRADGIPGSERHAAHRRASAGRGERAA